MARLIVGATWEDAPHLSREAKDALWNSIPEYQRDARTKGIPQLGSGAIYPFSETAIRTDPFAIPSHWAKAWAFDTALAGMTAAVWACIDPESGVAYIYDVYKRPMAETAVHASAFESRGKWIPGVGDAAAIADSDKTSFLDKYRAYGFNVQLADKSVENGISAVYDRLSSGTLKVFTSCPMWFDEFRNYKRNDKGRIVKKNDHLMDCTRYLAYSALRQARRKEPTPKGHNNEPLGITAEATLAWMR